MLTVKHLWNIRARLKAETPFGFRHRVAKQWNELPPSIKNAPTLNAFKNRLDSLEKFQSLFVEYDE
jgi:hypothetical protein